MKVQPQANDMKTNKQLAILIVDISGSTSLQEQLGKRKMQAAISRCLDQINQLISQWHGNQAKNNVNEAAMYTFPTAEQAGQAAIAIQRCIQNFCPVPDLCFKVWIGLHYGKVSVEKDGIVGDGVDMAVQMVSLAKNQQIIATKEALQLMPEEQKMTGRQLDTSSVQKNNQPVQVYEICWEEQSDKPSTRIRQPGSPASNYSLKLLFKDQSIVINKKNSSATLGRGDNNTLAIHDPLISRRHARLEYRLGGDFFLIDQSKNGIFVTNHRGEERFIHKDEMRLEGRGLISLGDEMTPDSSIVIYYDATFISDDNS